MRKPISLAVAIGLATLPLDTLAQSFTLDYVNQVSGSYTYLPPNWKNPQALPSTIFNGTVNGTLTYTESNGQYELTDEIFTLTGTHGAALQFFDAPAPLSNFLSSEACDLMGHCIDLTVTDNVPISATVNIADSLYNASQTQLNIGNTLSLSYEWGGVNGVCANQFTSSGGISVYTGSGINVCNLTASSSSAGIWTDPPDASSAPELDPTSLGSVLTLLAGCLIIIRNKKY